MRFGQIEQLLDARAEPRAQPFAATECDQRMRELIALAERIRPRIEERGDPLHPIGRRHDQRGERGGQQHEQRRKQARRKSAEKEHAECDAAGDEERAEVGLAQQQVADDQHRAEHRQESLLDALHVGRLAHRVVRGVEHREQLHDFRRLQIEARERNPATAAVDVLSDSWNQHQHEQHDANEEQPRREALPKAKRHLDNGRRKCDPEDDEDAVSRKEVRAAITGEARRFGGCDRG